MVVEPVSDAHDETREAAFGQGAHRQVEWRGKADDARAARGQRAGSGICLIAEFPGRLEYALTRRLGHRPLAAEGMGDGSMVDPGLSRHVVDRDHLFSFQPPIDPLAKRVA